MDRVDTVLNEDLSPIGTYLTIQVLVSLGKELDYRHVIKNRSKHFIKKRKSLPRMSVC